MRPAEKTRAVTRADVARAAKTSATTVSYVINDGPKSVSPATRKRVLQAIEDLGYRPNLIARSLRADHTETIGMIVPQIENPFFAGLVAAIEEEAAAQGKMVLFGTTGYSGETEGHYLASFDDRRVDAILAIGPSKKLRDSMNRGQGALFILDRAAKDSVVAIGINHRTAAKAATDHLFAHGYDTVACIAGPSTRTVAATRARGWRDALRAHGVTAGPELLRRAEYSMRGGYQAAWELFRGPARPRAAFVSSDVQTIGAISALNDLGLSVPGDAALFSFDGTRVGEFLVPRVSAVQQPIRAMAKMAMEVLQDRNRKARNIVVPFEIVLRESCGCTSRPTGEQS